ncbi:MAG: hypothetical protein Q8N18_15150 [Opitutaceae bacterium]|nr:hypothetical protein [Opitutaceae bacterium]
MNPHPQIFPIRVLPAVIACLAIGPALIAQTLIMPVPGRSSPLDVARDLSTGTKRSAPTSSFESALASGAPLLKTGTFVYSGDLSYRYIDGTRLRSETGNDRDTAIQAFIFAGTLAVGRHWSISHSTTKSYYENDEFRDPLDYNASVSAGYIVGEWNVAGALSYSLTNDTILEIGAQTTRESYGSSLSGSRQIGPKTTIDLSGHYSFGTATGLVNGRSISVNESINYKVSPKLNMGVGLSHGISLRSAGADSDFFRPQLRASWQPTAKTSLSASAGYEYRHFDVNGRNRLENPVYNLSLGYSPVAPTSFTVSASASEGDSFFLNRATRTTGLTFGVEQRFLGRFFFTGSYSSGKTDYVAVDRGLILDRRDKSDAFGASLSTAFSRRASLSLSYTQIKNTSDTTRFSQSSHQYTLNLGYRL